MLLRFGAPFVDLHFGTKFFAPGTLLPALAPTYPKPHPPHHPAPPPRPPTHRPNSINLHWRWWYVLGLCGSPPCSQITSSSLRSSLSFGVFLYTGVNQSPPHAQKVYKLLHYDFRKTYFRKEELQQITKTRSADKCKHMSKKVPTYSPYP